MGWEGEEEEEVRSFGSPYPVPPFLPPPSLAVCQKVGEGWCHRRSLEGSTS